MYELDKVKSGGYQISFPPASRIVSISVTIIQDLFTEINETRMFSVVLSAVFLTRSMHALVEQLLIYQIRRELV